MRYTVSVQHKSEEELDFKWYPLSTTDNAAAAIHEHHKFQEFYGRPVRIVDAEYRFARGGNSA